MLARTSPQRPAEPAAERGLKHASEQHLLADPGRQRDQGDLGPRALLEQRHDFVVAELLDQPQRADRPPQHSQEQQDQGNRGHDSPERVAQAPDEMVERRMTQQPAQDNENGARPPSKNTAKMMITSRPADHPQVPEGGLPPSPTPVRLCRWPSEEVPVLALLAPDLHDCSRAHSIKLAASSANVDALRENRSRWPESDEPIPSRSIGPTIGQRGVLAGVRLLADRSPLV